MSRIAFLGLGAMGSRMATNLLALGHDVTVWNRDAGKAEALRRLGAEVAGSPLAAASQAGFVFTAVRDDEASRRVWLDPKSGALAALSADAIGIECSTLSLGWARELARQFSVGGKRLVEAPVVGSRLQAEQRQLIFLVGAAAEALTGVQPILMSLGAAIHHLGQPGSATMAKLAVNALYGIQVCALAELICAIRRQELDPARLIEAIAATPAASPSARSAAHAMLAGNFSPAFPAGLAEKDLGYVLGAVGRDDLAPTIAAARAVFERAVTAGYADDNLTGVVRLYPSISKLNNRAGRRS